MDNDQNPRQTPPASPPDYSRLAIPQKQSPPPVHHKITKHRSRRSEGWLSILSTISVLLVAPLVALCLTAFVFQSYQVDGESMETTLQNNDRLIVWKMQRTWARITGHSYIPARGDIVIFTEHAMSKYGSATDSKQLIKRVIGLPGDHVVVEGGVITVFNEDHPNGFSPDATLPYGKNIQTTSGDVDLVVRDGEVFVCGDNRGNSLDSRVFGPVPANDIVGKLVLRVFPLNSAERF